ncbi:MAG: PadR family transcriptional regulator [Clostridiales bacterium]|nr:PadR family transcriptional regulator [Clostridiales bacterium]
MAREKKIDMVILGLLSHEDLTGYDIKKRMDGAISFFWKGSFGNIYPALKEMESQKLITKETATVGGREKITYHISSDGTKKLGEWLKEEQAINELRYETLLKLFFGGTQERKVSIHNIEGFEAQVKVELEMLKGYAKTLEAKLDNEDHLYYYLTATFGIESYEAYLKWCTKAKKMLK